MSVTINELLPFCMQGIIGCPAPFAEAAFNEAARKFCEGSYVWNERIPITVEVGNSELVIPPAGTGATIYTVTDAYMNDRPLEAASERALYSLLGDGWKSKAGRPQYFYLIDDFTQKKIRLAPAATEAGELIVKAIYFPKPDATEYPNILKQYVSDIALGVKAILHAQVGMPYSNMILSNEFYRQFNGVIGTAKHLAVNDNVKRPLRSAVCF